MGKSPCAAASPIDALAVDELLEEEAGDRDHGAMGSALTAEHDAAGGGAETRLDFKNNFQS